jgi:coenzyme F420-reducing hydrogenase delta subunit
MQTILLLKAKLVEHRRVNFMQAVATRFGAESGQINPSWVAAAEYRRTNYSQFVRAIY